MDFNDLLRIEGIDPKNVAVALHKPSVGSARHVVRALVEEDFEAFNAMQSTHPSIQEATLKARPILASFVTTGEGQMSFVGLFANKGMEPFLFFDENTRTLFSRMRQKPEGADQRSENERLADLKDRLLFDLREIDALADLSGRLVIRDPGARNYMRVAERTSLPVIEIARDGRIAPPVPDWDDLVLTAEELRSLPRDWRGQLAAWRGVCLIVDRADGARYVGAAYGADNLFGRWSAHVAAERGITKELAGRDPVSFRFSILDLLSPSAEAPDVIQCERKWMGRLATITHGLNS